MSNIIEFIRKKDYLFIEQIGQGGAGKTVLLKDEYINEYFICKKYSPYYEEHKEVFYNYFVDEIKILHRLYHRNIVRVFNYYLYPEYLTGYILMEYIKGQPINEFVANHPESINETFDQIIDGFQYLEENKILHRDIRKLNIIITDDGIVKIIDFGFGKIINNDDDFNKSISLNWWCELPNEFSMKIYDFKTEVYFIGKLFEQLIIENDIESFQYNELLQMMIDKNYENRIISFKECQKIILNKESSDIEFEQQEVNVYRNFSDSLCGIITKIERKAAYFNDSDLISHKLETIYKNVMLEENIPNGSALINCFINGTCYYKKNIQIPTIILKSFKNVFKKCSKEKQNIMISNIQSKLDSIERYYEEYEGPF